MSGVYDETTPAGTEAISNGDDRIREVKIALRYGLLAQGASGVEAVFPGSAPLTAPVYRPRFLKGNTGSRPAASADQGIYINTTTNTIQRCDDSSWIDVATLIPSGTVMCFFQASAPTGWTQVTSQNDKLLRVVSGSGGGTGGSNAFSSSFTGKNTGSEAAHTHSVSGTTSGGTGSVNVASGVDQAVAVISHTHTLSVTSGAGSSHLHTIPDFAPNYVDMILASKD